MIPFIVMKNADFVALLTANANKTQNIRVYSRVWPSGARRIPTPILNRVGCIVSLVQNKVNEKVLCDPDTEGIIIYNFQPVMLTKECRYISIDMLRVPHQALEHTSELNGVPTHLVVDVTTSEVVNNTKSMLDLGLISEDDVISEAMEPPVIYGKYTDYQPMASFMAIATAAPLVPEHIFNGTLDTAEVTKEAPLFDTHLEAQNFLLSSTDKDKCPNQLIAEISSPKEHKEKVLREGLSSYAVKTFTADLMDVHGTSRPNTRVQEHNQEDEVHMLMLANDESEVRAEETIPLSASTDAIQPRFDN